MDWVKELQRPGCDGPGPHASGVLKLVRMPEPNSSAILCRSCFLEHLMWLLEHGTPFSGLPLWFDLETYKEPIHLFRSGRA